MCQRIYLRRELSLSFVTVRSRLAAVQCSARPAAMLTAAEEHQWVPGAELFDGVGKARSAAHRLDRPRLYIVHL